MPLIAILDFNVDPHISVLMEWVNYDKKRIFILWVVLGKPENNENNNAALARNMKYNLQHERQI